MSVLTRYPVPQAGASGAVDASRFHFLLEPQDLPVVLEFLQPLRGKEVIESGAFAAPDSQVLFRLGVPAPPPIAVELPIRAIPLAAKSGDVDDPRLYFLLEPAPPIPVVLDFLRPIRGKESISIRAADAPKLHFRLTPTVIDVAADDWYPRIRRRRR